MGSEERLIKFSNFTFKQYFKDLLELDEKADEEQFLTLFHGSNNPISFRKSPIDKELGRYYGEINAMLHTTFFEYNDNWYYKKKLSDTRNKRSLVDYREIIEKTISKFDEATQGSIYSITVNKIN